MGGKTTIRFVYIVKGESVKEKQAEIDQTLLGLRDDINGYLEGKRPFPAYLDIETKRKGCERING